MSNPSEMPPKKPLRKPLDPPVNPDRLRGVRLICIQAVSELYRGHGIDADMEHMLMMADEFYHWVVYPELPQTGDMIQRTPRLNPKDE